MIQQKLGSKPLASNLRRSEKRHLSSQLIPSSSPSPPPETCQTLPVPVLYPPERSRNQTLSRLIYPTSRFILISNTTARLRSLVSKFLAGATKVPREPRSVLVVFDRTTAGFFAVPSSWPTIIRNHLHRVEDFICIMVRKGATPR